MAAIALGGRKIDSSFELLREMTLNDSSGYARRCAAYALGLLGRAEAVPILEKALKDPEAFVRNNAEAALTMLKRAARGARRRHFVRIVVDTEKMTFQGQPATWAQLPARLSKIPNRRQTVLEVAVSSDEVSIRRKNQVVGRASGLARQRGFEYTSYIGVHALGSKGSASQVIKAAIPTEAKPEPPKYEPLALVPAPWADGEVLRLDLKSPTGVSLGGMIYEAANVRIGPKTLQRLESRMVVPLSNTLQFTRVDVDPQTLQPVSALTKNNVLGHFRAEYTSAGVNWGMQTAQKQASRKVPIGHVAYDNEQVMYLLRRLPLAVGYKASFAIFSVQTGIVSDCRINVDRREKVTVPAGTFDCYKVMVRAASAGASIQQESWISADSARYFVRMSSPQAVMELAEVAAKDKDKPRVFRDNKLQLSVTAPAAWYFHRSAPTGPYPFILYMLPPEMKAWCVLAAAPRVPVIASARQAAEGDLDALKKYFKAYKVRPTSWAESHVGGLPAATFAADYQDNKRPMVEYRTYLLGESMVYWFVFRIDKDRFEAAKAEFDAIIATLKAPPPKRPADGPGA